MIKINLSAPFLHHLLQRLERILSNKILVVRKLNRGEVLIEWINLKDGLFSYVLLRIYLWAIASLILAFIDFRRDTLIWHLNFIQRARARDEFQVGSHFMTDKSHFIFKLLLKSLFSFFKLVPDLAQLDQSFSLLWNRWLESLIFLKITNYSDHWLWDLLDWWLVEYHFLEILFCKNWRPVWIILLILLFY